MDFAPLQLIFSVGLPTLLGALAARRICRGVSLPIVFLLAAGFGLGTGILSQWMLLLAWLGLPFNLATISLPMLTAALLLWLDAHRNRHFVAGHSLLPGPHYPADSSLSPALKALIYTGLLIFIIGHIYVISWRSLNTPVRWWDGLSFIAFNAKVFFYEQGLYQPQYLPHPSYPLHVPFLLTWTALNLGAWDEQLIKIIFPSTLLAYLGLHYSFLRQYTGRLWALGGIAVLLSSALFTYHATIEYRDFSLLYFNCSTIFLLLLWEQHKKNGLLILAGLFGGFTTFTKLEGMMYLLIQAVLLGMILRRTKGWDLKEKTRRALTFLLPAGALCLFYLLWKILAGIPLTERAGLEAGVDYSYRITTALGQFLTEIFLSQDWNIIWFLLTVSLAKLAMHPHDVGPLQRRGLTILLTAVSLFIGAYFLLAVLTTNFIWLAGIQAADGLPRVFLHFFPLAAAALVLIHARADQRQKTPGNEHTNFE